MLLLLQHHHNLSPVMGEVVNLPSLSIFLTCISISFCYKNFVKIISLSLQNFMQEEDIRLETTRARCTNISFFFFLEFCMYLTLLFLVEFYSLFPSLQLQMLSKGMRNLQIVFPGINSLLLISGPIFLGAGC